MKPTVRLELAGSLACLATLMASLVPGTTRAAAA